MIVILLSIAPRRAWAFSLDILFPSRLRFLTVFRDRVAFGADGFPCWPVDSQGAIWTVANARFGEIGHRNLFRLTFKDGVTGSVS